MTLIERLERATGPDRGLDGMIARDLAGWSATHGLRGDAILEWPNLGGHWHPKGDRCDNHHAWTQAEYPDPPRYTADMNVALALAKQIVPGCQWTIEEDACWLRRMGRTDVEEFQGVLAGRGGDCTAIAIILAAAKAKATHEPHHRIRRD